MAEAKSGAGRIEAAATVSWRGWGGEVSGESGKLKARTATQVELGGPGQATNPEELLAAALANCYTSTITAHARAKKIDLASIETQARTRLAWDEKTPHHIAEGALSVTIHAAAPAQTLRDLAEEARRHCPICNVLGATAKVTLSVAIAPPDA
jgi:organic hydroperoxide reductase OsmC/OhrA